MHCTTKDFLRRSPLAIKSPAADWFYTATTGPTAVRPVTDSLGWAALLPAAAVISTRRAPETVSLLMSSAANASNRSRCRSSKAAARSRDASRRFSTAASIRAAVDSAYSFGAAISPAEERVALADVVRHRPELVAHAPHAHHPAREVGGRLEVALRARRRLAEDELLCRPTAELDGQPGEQRVAARSCGDPPSARCWVTPSAGRAGRS